MSDWRIWAGGREYGPMDEATAKVYARENPDAKAHRTGWTDWVPVADVPELARKKPAGSPPQANISPPQANISPPPVQAGPPPVPPAPPSPPTVAPPPVPPQVGLSQGSSNAGSGSSRSQFTAEASGGYGGAGHTDGIDWRIQGAEMQFVEVELDPGESVVAEAGALMFKEASVEMQTIFGDGREAQGGFFGRLVQAGQRLVTGEGLFTTVFTQRGSGKGRAAFAAPYPGNILALPLQRYGGRIICQKDSFLAAARGVSLSIYFQKRILTGLFGGEGFIMQKVEGTGTVFVHMGGTLVERELAPGEELHVDTGCVAAFAGGIDFDVMAAGGVKTMLFGGEGMFLARLRGPGHVWLQSLPFSRLAGRMAMAAASPRGGADEGSLLGGIQDIFQR